MAGWGDTSLQISPDEFPDPEVDIAASTGEQSVVLAGGCFWCVEAVFAEVDGVLGMTSGYAPIGAMIATDRLMEPFRQGTTSFAHGTSTTIVGASASSTSTSAATRPSMRFRPTSVSPASSPATTTPGS